MLWAHHLATRWMAAFRSPRDCYVGFAAAFMLTGAQMSARWVNHNVDWVFAALTLSAVTSFVAMSGAGASTGGRPPGFGSARSEARDIPNPTLPLDPGVRALMEALAGVGVMAVWQTLLVVIAPLSRSLVPIDLGGSGLGSLSGTFATWCVIVPGAMAWLLPAQSQVVNLLRGVTVMMLAATAFEISVSSMPWAIDLTVALVAVLLATARVAMIPGPFNRLVRRSDARTTSRPDHRAGGSLAKRRDVMFRESRAPLAQLWRDACLGPLRSGKLPFVACAACFLAVGALARAHIGSEMLAGFVTTLGPLLVAVWLALHALGTPTTTAGRGVRAGLFSGDIGLAWTSLPLRREWVMRAFYMHGIMTGLTFVALSLLAFTITGSPPLFEIPGEPFSWIPFLCAVPPFAGVMTCQAAGDPVRGVISAASLFLVWTALPYDSAPFAVAFALTGGVPPLVHLFNRRSPRR